MITPLEICLFILHQSTLSYIRRHIGQESGSNRSNAFARDPIINWVDGRRIITAGYQPNNRSSINGTW